MKQRIHSLKSSAKKSAKKLLRDKKKTKAILRKSIIATEKLTKLSIITNNNNYSKWLKKNNPSEAELQKQIHESENFDYKPLISIVTPVYKTPEVLLDACVKSVLGQTYNNWELILVDDASKEERLRRQLTQYSQTDSRIKVLFNKNNLHIADATNVGI